MDEEHRGCGDGLRSLLIRLVVLLLRLEAKRGREGEPRRAHQERDALGSHAFSWRMPSASIQSARLSRTF